jgi:uncharacterized protein YbaP (TraB family)
MKTLIFAVFFCYSLLAQSAGERLFFYEVESAGAKVWLLGSIHLARPDIYPLRAEIQEAFAASDSLVVEVDIGGGNELAIQQMMLTRGTYPSGETVQQHLSAKTWNDLQIALRQFGLPVEVMAQFKPGMLVTTLSTMHMMKLGLAPEFGVDRHFLMSARGSKEILELETIEQQIDMLMDFPDEELLVKQTLEQLDQMDLIMSELVSAWKSGDSVKLERLIIDDDLARDPRYRKLHERMFDERNRKMVSKVDGYLKRGGTYFVVVGAGHLVGDVGMIDLLKRRGYQPRQL